MSENLKQWLVDNGLVLCWRGGDGSVQHELEAAELAEVVPPFCEHAWKDCEVGCDDCGSHPGVTCEHCEATLDLIRVCDPRELARMPEATS